MSDATDLSAMAARLEQLQATVEAQAAELARLSPRAPMARRHLLRGLATLAVGGVAVAKGAEPAAASDGDPLLIGVNNAATAATRLDFDGPSSTAAFTARNLAGGDLTPPTAFNPGVLGTGFVGVQGYGASAGILGQATGADGLGVWARAQGSASAAALGADSTVGPAMRAASGDGVTLRLDPADRTGPPASVPSGRTAYEPGSFTVDDQGDLWLCVASGDPGTWTRLLREDTAAGRMVPITPFRALDTRSPGGRPPGAPTVAGQRTGPVRGGQTITLDLAGVSPIPTTATGLFGNLIVVDPTYDGYARVRPSGSNNPASSVNFASGINALANSFTSALGPAGLTLSASGTTTNRVHLVLDVAGYLT